MTIASPALFSAIAHSVRYQAGRIRTSALVVLAVALMAGGVLLAIESMSVEAQMRTYYEEALALSQLAD